MITEPLNPETDCDDDEYEYEEIEVEIEVEEEFEEEIEVDEEIEVEQEMGEELGMEANGVGEGEIKQDSTTLPEENQLIDMVLEEPVEHLQSSSVTRGIPNSDPLIDIPTISKDVGCVKTFESCENEDLPVNGKRPSGDNDPKSPFCSSGKVNHAGKTPLIGKDYDTALLMLDAFNQKDNTRETKHTATEALTDIKQMSPRSHVSQLRFREPAMNAEFDRENKKLRIICELHAKGWCVKGSSCRFLHIKDGLDPMVNKYEPLEKQQASSNVFVLPHKSEGNPKSSCKTDKLCVTKDDNLGAFPLGDNRGNFGHNLYLENYSYPYGNYSSSVASHDNHYISGLSGFRNTDLPYSLSRRPLSLGSSSWNTNNKLSSDCWEPSVAFCPSHPITQNLLRKEILYGPIRDIEKKSVEEIQVRTSHSDQGSSIKNVNNVQSSNTLAEDRLLDTVKDNNKKILISCRGNKKQEESDGHKGNESKALKYFQAELVEFVKELVRPKWHEGLLSREAHKLVVKKAVDKVVSSLQPQKIPSTVGSIKSYLSSSRAKIANLVEAYIEKYGKTRKAGQV